MSPRAARFGADGEAFDRKREWFQVAVRSLAERRADGGHGMEKKIRKIIGPSGKPTAEQILEMFWLITGREATEEERREVEGTLQGQ